MTPHPVEPGTEEGWSVIDVAVRSAQARLGERLLSAYAIGSLAHGGFSRAVSDIDLALLTDERRDRDMTAVVAAVAADVAGSGLALGNRLSVFHAPWDRFADPPGDARFPPIDRHDLMHYGRLVAGRDLRDVYGRSPGAAEIREQAVDSALRRVTPRQLRIELRRLARGGITVHDASKTVLWPARLQHVCDTGRATGNGPAVEHYLALADARHRALVADALDWRNRGAVTDPQAARRRIGDEIGDLHAEVLARVSRRPDVPRRDEIALRARRLTAARWQRFSGRP